MIAGIRDIMIITTRPDREAFENLLGDGASLGINLSYATQDKPNGIAEAFLIGKDFIKNDDVALVLGDNFFYGAGLSSMFSEARKFGNATIFVTEVSNPSDYGVVEINNLDKPVAIVEKPKVPNSNLAITGLYFLDASVVNRAETVVPSARGELEITEVLTSYLNDSKLNVSFLSRGMAWLDTGTPNSLHDASSFVRVIEERTGMKIGCPEEISWRNGWIDKDQLLRLAENYGKNEYGVYLKNLVSNSPRL
jgi:glucose-1-phosphate thymidylyltransferase